MRLPVAVDEHFRLFDVVLETGGHIGGVTHDRDQWQEDDEDLEERVRMYEASAP